MNVPSLKDQSYFWNNHPIANAQKPTDVKKKAKTAGREEGAGIVSTGDFYTAPEINAETIRNLREDIYVEAVLKKQRNLIFNEKYKLSVIDIATGEVDDELSKQMYSMCESKNVRIWAKMQRSYDDSFLWGISPYNPVWGVDPEAETNEIRLLKLRHLPPETFKTEPEGSDDIYSPILKGIIPDKDGELEFHQEPKADETPELIKNVFYVKNPADRGFAGDPIIIPMVGILGMLGFTWNTQMEQVNRVGAKILFMKVTNPTKATVNKFQSIEHANDILSGWGKDTGFVIPENFDPVDLKLTDDSNNLEVIDALSNLIMEYVTPASFISAGQETRLGGNDNAQKELLDNYIRGVHSWIEDQFEMLLMRYLEYNQYTGFEVKITIPMPSHDSRDENRKDAETLFLTQSGDVNELRKLLGHNPLDEAELSELAEHYKGVTRVEELIRT